MPLSTERLALSERGGAASLPELIRSDPQYKADAQPIARPSSLDCFRLDDLLLLGTLCYFVFPAPAGETCCNLALGPSAVGKPQVVTKQAWDQRTSAFCMHLPWQQAGPSCKCQLACTPTAQSQSRVHTGLVHVCMQREVSRSVRLCRRLNATKQDQRTEVSCKASTPNAQQVDMTPDWCTRLFLGPAMEYVNF